MQTRHGNEKKISLAMVSQRLQSNDSRLTYLNFNHMVMNPIHGVSHITDADLIQLAQALGVNTTLTAITIEIPSATQITAWTAVGSKAIGQSLKNHPALQCLEIHLTNFNRDAGRFVGLLDALTGTAPIAEFQFSVHKFSTAILEVLAESLLQNTRLKSISISSVLYYVLFQPSSIEKLAAGLFIGKTLEKLSLHRVVLSDASAYFATHLATVRSLSTLSLAHANLSFVAFHALASAIKENHGLTFLNLSHNPLYLDGLKELMRVVPSLSNLRRLDLTNTQLEDLALRYLVRHWRKSNLGISKLILDGNSFTGAAIHSIKKLINNNFSLKELRVQHAGITSSTFNALVPLLSNSKKCHLELFLSSGSMVRESASISRILTSNPFIQVNPLWDFGLHDTENEKNKKYIAMRYQQEWLNQAVRLANVFTGCANSAKSALPNFSLLIVMSMLCGDQIKGMNTLLCNQLILNSFTQRRMLINEGRYNPEGKNPRIDTWWKKEMRSRENIKTVFTHNRYASLFCREPVCREPAVETNFRCVVM